MFDVLIDQLIRRFGVLSRVVLVTELIALAVINMPMLIGSHTTSAFNRIKVAKFNA